MHNIQTPYIRGYTTRNTANQPQRRGCQDFAESCQEHKQQLLPKTMQRILHDQYLQQR